MSSKFDILYRAPKQEILNAILTLYLKGLDCDRAEFVRTIRTKDEDGQWSIGIKDALDIYVLLTDICDSREDLRSLMKQHFISQDKDSEKTLQLLKAAVKAYAELNTIRARDGVPYTNEGKSTVDQDYFSSVVDELDNAVRTMTGKSAHCHPLLYK